jgi:hypothetical protein
MSKCIAISQNGPCKLDARFGKLCYKHAKMIETGEQIIYDNIINEDFVVKEEKHLIEERKISMEFCQNIRPTLGQRQNFIAQNKYAYCPNNPYNILEPINKIEPILKLKPIIPLVIEGEFECQCCYTKYQFTELITCSRACEEHKHAFCKDCMKGYIESELSEKKASLRCMMSIEKCGGEFSKQTIKDCIDEKTFKTFEDQALISEIISFAKILDNYQTCPFCEKYACQVDNTITFCICERCEKSWCIKCRRLSHDPHPCNKITDNTDVEGIKRIVHETMTNALIHKCPTCHTKYIKETGCNMMHCSCGNNSCYLCNSKISTNIGYDHFKNSKCRLYNDGTGKGADQGNAKFNNEKLINECNKLLNVNSYKVQKIIRQEMILQGIIKDEPNMISSFVNDNCVIC